MRHLLTDVVDYGSYPHDRRDGYDHYVIPKDALLALH